MRFLMAIVACGLLLGCAHSDPWSGDDTFWLIVSEAAIVADGISTTRAIHDGCIETGALGLIGKHPSDREVWAYMGSRMVTSWLIMRALPAKWRPYWGGFHVFTNGVAARNNFKLNCPGRRR